MTNATTMAKFAKKTMEANAEELQLQKWLSFLQTVRDAVCGPRLPLTEETIRYSHLHSNDDVFELVFRQRHSVGRAFSHDHFVILAKASEEEIEDSPPEKRPNWRLINLLSLFENWTVCTPIITGLKPEPNSDPENVHVNLDGLELVLCPEHLRSERVSRSITVIMTTSGAEEKVVYIPEKAQEEPLDPMAEIQNIPEVISMDQTFSEEESLPHDYPDATPTEKPEETYTDKPAKLKDVWISDADVVLGPEHDATPATDIFVSRVCPLYAQKAEIRESHVRLMIEILQEEVRDSKDFDNDIESSFWVLLSESWDGMADGDSSVSKWLLKGKGDFAGPYVKASPLAVQKFVKNVLPMIKQTKAQRTTSDGSVVSLDVIELARDCNGSTCSNLSYPVATAVEAPSVMSTATAEATHKYHLSLDPLTEETHLVKQPTKASLTTATAAQASEEEKEDSTEPPMKKLSEYLTKYSKKPSTAMAPAKTRVNMFKSTQDASSIASSAGSTGTTTPVAVAISHHQDDDSSLFHLSGSIHEVEANICKICNAWVDNSESMVIRVMKKCSVEMFYKDVKDLLPLISRQVQLIQGIQAQAAPCSSSWVALESNGEERRMHAEHLENAFLGFLNQLGNDMIRRYERFYKQFSPGQQQQDYRLIKGPSTTPLSNTRINDASSKNQAANTVLPSKADIVPTTAAASVAAYHVQVNTAQTTPVVPTVAKLPPLHPDAAVKLASSNAKKISWQDTQAAKTSAATSSTSAATKSTTSAAAIKTSAAAVTTTATASTAKAAKVPPPPATKSKVAAAPVAPILSGDKHISWQDMDTIDQKLEQFKKVLSKTSPPVREGSGGSISEASLRTEASNASCSSMSFVGRSCLRNPRTPVVVEDCRDDSDDDDEYMDEEEEDNSSDASSIVEEYSVRSYSYSVDEQMSMGGSTIGSKTLNSYLSYESDCSTEATDKFRRGPRGKPRRGSCSTGGSSSQGGGWLGCTPLWL